MDNGLARTFLTPVLIVFPVLLLLIACDRIELSGDEYLQRAQAYLRSGDIESAMIEASNAAQRQPRNPEIRRLLGEIYLGFEDGESAVKELSRARELGDQDPGLRLLLIKAYLLQGRYTEALAVDLNGGVLETAQQQAELLALRGDAELGNGRPEAAREYYLKAQSTVSGFPPARLGEARVAVAKGSVAEALRSLYDLVGDRTAYTDAWLLIGQLELSEGRAVEAEAAFTETLRTAPRRGRAITMAAYQAHVGQVFALVQQDRLEEAAGHAESLRRSLPRHFMPKYLQGFIAYYDEDFESANRYLQQSHAENRQFVPNLLLLGAVNYALENFRQAEMYLSQYTSLEPDDARARKLLGATRLQVAQPGRAMAVLREALVLSPDDSQLLAMLGTAAMRMGDPVTSREYLERLVARGAAGVDMQTELARAFLAEGNNLRAAAMLERTLADEPRSQESGILLIIAHIRQGELDDAERLTRDMLERDGDDPLLLTLLGEIALERGDTSAARRQFNHALDAAGGNFGPARLNLAELAMRDGDLDAARLQFEAAIKDPPSAVQAMLGLANLELEYGDESAGIEWLEKARNTSAEALRPRILLGRYYLQLQQPDDARRVAVEALQVSPDNREALIILAESQINLRRFQDAAVALAQLARLEPRDADIQYRLAQVNIELDRTETARSALEEARKLRPGFLAATVTLAMLEQRTGNPAKALALADELKRRRPDSADGYALEGDLRMLQGNPSAAARAYAEALRKQPDAPRLLLSRFQALSASGDRQAARLTLQQWLDAYPDDQNVRLALANSYQSDGDSGRARMEYEKILEGDPDHAVALNNLAWLYLEDQDPRALEFAERAYRKLPGNPAIADTLGWALVQRDQDLSRAVQLLRRAAEALPQSLETRYHLAAALVKTGDRHQARQILRGLIESGQEFSGRSAADQLYREINPQPGSG